MRRRPVYYPKLGAFLTGLRQAKAQTDPRWKHQTHAATQAEKRHIRPLTRQVILRMERGQTQNPREEVLRGFAQLYGVSEDLVIGKFLEERYATDLVRHTAVLSSSSDTETQGHDAGESPTPRSLSTDQLDQIFQAATEIRTIATSALEWAERLERLAGDIGIDLTGKQTPVVSHAPSGRSADRRRHDRPDDRTHTGKRRKPA